jgi:hypothetical protein
LASRQRPAINTGWQLAVEVADIKLAPAVGWERGRGKD